MGYSAEIVSCIAEKGKQTRVGKLICSSEIMKKVNSVFNDLILNRLVHELKIRMDATVDNKWQVLHPIDYSFGMACSGLDIKQPIF